MTEGEHNLIMFQRGMSGSFMTNLFKTIFSADLSNLYKLILSFPEEVTAAKKWMQEEGYAEKLEEEFSNRK